MDYLPLFFKLENRTVVLVGGGQVALRKASLLVQAGARLVVISHAVNPELAELVNTHQGEVIIDDYHSKFLNSADLVIAATDDYQLNSRVHFDAVERRLPVSVVNNPALCSFIFPAIIDRSPVIIGVSSGGESPVLARLLRAKLETWIPQGYSRLGKLVGQFREQVAARFSGVNEQHRFWEKTLQGQVAENVFAGCEDAAAKLLQRALDECDPEYQPAYKTGEVYLVGAGPGDPELLTFKALRLMQQADVVLYDQLVSAEVMALCHTDVEKIYVGKRCGNHAMSQEAINGLMVKFAHSGKRVLRLKGGDPFVFGRGGEELQALKQHEIPYQVVPGITAASACSTYAGIPLTHRNFAQSVTFVTGQLKNRTSDLNFAQLVHPNQTVVFYMGLQNMPYLFQQLIGHGRSADTPAAIVSRGATSEQKVLTGTLSDLAGKQRQAQLAAPALIIVGEVVSLHDDLAWFGEEVMYNHGLVLPDEMAENVSRAC
ncbi:siroheme synthase CysG [Amphritea sp. HPY]|uniref:siroheme synthase CysG n=1 Tax=Amphritea sp. HPY TaxID=3421652 RepID=UPI003D7CE8F3